ncbi:MAG: hypothetical protein HY910_06890 [Desulfarculus sp.]|nr:hypothetical protein [Desulfarculus sp.]
MFNPTLDPRREIIAALMCSRLYFELRLSERLALVKSLCAYQIGGQGG